MFKYALLVFLVSVAWFASSLHQLQDGSGWTPLMIAVSLKDGEELVDLFLRKEADVNAKSMLLLNAHSTNPTW